MSVRPAYGDGNAVGVKSAPGRALRLENPRSSSRLNGECDRGEPNFDRRGSRPTRRGESHFGTIEDVSRWHGPRLTTPFAAQVIGQALNTPCVSASSANAAYRLSSLKSPSALVFDGDI
jgi:hypothetical protein